MTCSKKDRALAFLPLLFFGLLIFPHKSLAVPPPDFLFNVGSQIAYIFSFVAILFSATFGVVYQYLRVKYHAINKPKPGKFLLILFLISIVSIGAAYFYNAKRQEVAYLDWLEESEAQSKQASEEEVEKEVEVVPVEEVQTSDFWELNKDTALSISNEEFQALLDSGREDYLVLDARENLENGYGHFPGSTHLRFADIYAGLTEGLPKDKFIYVLCWSGIRGKETVELLRAQNLVAVYLEGGADSWVTDYGGLWEGTVKFSSVYPDSEYAITYSTDETRQKVSDGVILVDAREPEKISVSTIDSYAMPLMYTPTDDLEAMYALIPSGSRVITICDEYTNCFMAKLVGVELEIRGAEFLGRYNRPWEY
ncbi:MAG: rhodanese-like domain-containing protein [Candidatus Gracilibacteria bacterium]